MLIAGSGQTLMGLPLGCEDEFTAEVNDGIKLIQKKRGLSFGTDALLLSAFIKARKNSTAVEFGAGSGIISLLCAQRRKFTKIFAVEIQQLTLERNIVLNSFENVIEPICSDVRELKLKDVDAVFTNPPYMKTNSGKRNDDNGKYIARHEVYGDIDDFCISAAGILKYGGLFYVVYRPDRMVDLLCAMRNAGIEPKRLVTVYQDSRHEPCLILVEGKRGAMPSLFTPKPLIMFENGLITEDLKFIYENGEFNANY